MKGEYSHIQNHIHGKGLILTYKSCFTTSFGVIIAIYVVFLVLFIVLERA